MTVTTGVLPYDLANLLGGAARVIVSDDATALPAIPANIADFQLMVSPYTPATGWRDIGATADSTDYTRDIAESGLEIEQASGAVFTEVTDVSRTIKFEMAEVTPENLRVMENSGAATTVAAAAGKSAQKALKVGSFAKLTKRRVVFLGIRNPDSGTVVEPVGSITRGRFVAYCAYNAKLSADASQFQMQKGGLFSGPVTMRSEPESGQPSGQEFGIWLLEDAGTIT